MDNWHRARWWRNIGSLNVVGHGRLCAICHGGDHHEDHCDDAPEPSFVQVTVLTHEDVDGGTGGQPEG